MQPEPEPEPEPAVAHDEPHTNVQSVQLASEPAGLRVVESTHLLSPTAGEAPSEAPSVATTASRDPVLVAEQAKGKADKQMAMGIRLHIVGHGVGVYVGYKAFWTGPNDHISAPAFPRPLPLACWCELTWACSQSPLATKARQKP